MLFYFHLIIEFTNNFTKFVLPIELVIPIGIPTNEGKAEIETQTVTSETYVSE